MTGNTYGRAAVAHKTINQTAAYTPSGVLVLAGSLANCPPGKWFTKDTGKTIMAVGMARWLLLPLVTSGVTVQCKPDTLLFADRNYK